MKSSGVMLTSITSLRRFKGIWEREADSNFDITCLPSGVSQILAKSSEEISSVMICSAMAVEQNVSCHSIIMVDCIGWGRTSVRDVCFTLCDRCRS